MKQIKKTKQNHKKKDGVIKNIQKKEITKKIFLDEKERNKNQIFNVMKKAILKEK